MPGESETNGQVPQLKIQNEDNETVLIQNGTPKKVDVGKSENEPSQVHDNQKCELKKLEIDECELQSSEPEENQKCELEKVDNTENSNVSVNDQEKEVEKVETEKEQVVEAEQCQIIQVESEIQSQIHTPQNTPTQEETPLELEPLCPLRTSTEAEEPKIETENQHIESESQHIESNNQHIESEKEQVEAEKIEQCEIKKVESEDNVPSCPITPSPRIEEPKEDLITNGQQNHEIAQNGNPKKVSMFTTLDSDAIKSAYEDVRSDNSETQWAVFKFQGSRIALSATGSEFEKFREQFTENERGFGYIRIQTGDEMSKRQKFLFITWVGPGVSVIQRAKMSTDKSLIKNIVSNFAVELQLENESDFDLKHFVTELNKAGGANYGTGIRDF